MMMMMMMMMMMHDDDDDDNDAEGMAEGGAEGEQKGWQGRLFAKARNTRVILCPTQRCQRLALPRT